MPFAIPAVAAFVGWLYGFFSSDAIKMLVWLLVVAMLFAMAYTFVKA